MVCMLWDTPYKICMTEDASTSTLIVLKALEGNDPTYLSPLQTFLDAHIGTLETFWWTVFFVTFGIVLMHLVRAPKHMS